MKKLISFAAGIIATLVVLYFIGLHVNDTPSIPKNSEVCRACEGSKICAVCDGDGVLELPKALGGPRKCSFCAPNPGVCRTCKGTGYVIIDD